MNSSESVESLRHEINSVWYSFLELDTNSNAPNWKFELLLPSENSFEKSLKHKES